MKKAIIFLLTFCVFQVLAQEKIALKENAEIDSEFICLIDIVKQDNLSENTINIFKKVYLGRAPQKGEVKIIKPRHVIDELLRREVDITRFIFLHREAKVVRVKSMFKIINRIVERMKAQVVQNQRGLRLRQINIRILFMHPEIKDNDYEILSVWQKDAKITGISEFEITLSDKGRTLTIDAIVKIMQFRKVVCALRDINYGRRIKGDDLFMKVIEVENPDMFFTDLRLLKGAIAKRKIKKGEGISFDSVRLPKILRRGDKVKAVGKFIKTEAIALQDGAIGDVILLKHPQNKRQFKGMVVSKNKVLLNYKEEK
jgi:flagella basal body P-ring formation protein FlgA